MTPDLTYLLSRLDTSPADRSTLLIVADYHDDRGEQDLAEAWRWLWSEGKEPVKDDAGWFWLFGRPIGCYGSPYAMRHWLEFLVGEEYESKYKKQAYLNVCVAGVYQFAAREYVAAVARGWRPEVTV